MPARVFILLLLAIVLAAPVFTAARAQEPSGRANDLQLSPKPADALLEGDEQEKLRGKSVVVNWTEKRMQRREGQSVYRPAVRQGTFSVYVSTAGRVFSQISMRNPERGESGKRDLVGEGQRRHISLSGSTMTTVQEAAAGGARRIVITFDAALSSCTAELIRGKEQGADKIVARSLIRPDVRIEIASVKTSEVSCAVKAGNVFGEK